MRKGSSPNSRIGLDRGVSVLGAFKLDHWQPVEPILFWNFSNYFTFILGANSYYPRGLIMRKGNSHNSRNGQDWGDCVPGAFKLDHLHPVKPILFSKFYNFFTFILEANSYYPRGLIMRKGNSPNSRNWVIRGVSVPGAFKLDHLQPIKPILFPKCYNFFTFMLGGQFLLPQRGEGWKRENGFLTTWVWHRSLSAWGIQKLDHLKQSKPILFTKFYNFFTFMLGGQFLLPQGGEGWNGKMDFSQPEYGTGVWVPGAFKLDHLLQVKPILCL